MVNRAFGIDTKGFTADFSDVAAGQWYYGDIAAASASGYTGGYPDGTFKPKQSISRQEAASIMVRLLKLEPTTQGLDKFKDATRIPQWSRSSIGAIAKAGFMAGYPDGTFQPGKSITRAEAVASLDRARKRRRRLRLRMLSWKEPSPGTIKPLPAPPCAFSRLMVMQC